MKYLIFIFMLLFCEVAQTGEFRHFSDWTNKERAEFLVYAGLTYTDYRQTTWAIKQRKSDGNFQFVELNPVLGKRPSNESVGALLAVGAIWYYYLIGKDTEPFDTNDKARVIFMSVRIAAVAHNHMIGISVSKTW
jgi:hypothetical protein